MLITHWDTIDDICPRLERLGTRVIPLTGEEGVDMIIRAVNRSQVENFELRAQFDRQHTTIAQIIDRIELRA